MKSCLIKFLRNKKLLCYIIFSTSFLKNESDLFFCITSLSNLDMRMKSFYCGLTSCTQKHYSPMSQQLL